MARHSVFVVLMVSMAGIATGSAQVKPRRVDLVQYMQIGHAGVTRDLLAAAELMPEADYTFKPTSMPEARTFAAVIAHASGAMFDACARLKGVADSTPDAEKKLSSKAVVVQTLREAVTLCSEAVQALDATAAAEFVRQGPAEVPKSAVLAGLLAQQCGNVRHQHGISASKELSAASKSLALMRLFWTRLRSAG